MPPLSGRATGPAAFAVALASLLSVGCLNTDEKKEPLLLGSDTRSRLTNPPDTNPPKTARAASFDPVATGGSGVSVQNSFNRTTPGAGTGTGNFGGPLPPPQVGGPIGQQPVAVAPPLQGASYGEPAAEPGRSAMASRQPSAPPPVALPRPIKPVTAEEPTPSPFGPATPKLDPPSDPPPVQPVKFESLPTPAPIRPVLPDPERPPAPLPVPGPAANEPLPVAPPPPGVVPSPTDAPIPGVQNPPKLPAPDPIRPTVK